MLGCEKFGENLVKTHNIIQSSWIFCSISPNVRVFMHLYVHLIKDFAEFSDTNGLKKEKKDIVHFIKPQKSDHK